MAYYGYSTRIVKQNEKAYRSKCTVGVALGYVCIRKDIPVSKVARKFKVSRQTVYNWFSGDKIPRRNKIQKIQAFIAAVDK